jgi:hypothetical protein
MGGTTQNMVCTQCGTPADTGLIFCTKCGATLRPPVPLVTSPKLDASPARKTSANAILAIFLACAAIDFIWGYIHERSVVAGVVAIVLGLFGTAWYVFLLGGWKGGN